MSTCRAPEGSGPACGRLDGAHPTDHPAQPPRPFVQRRSGHRGEHAAGRSACSARCREAGGLTRGRETGVMLTENGPSISIVRRITRAATAGDTTAASESRCRGSTGQQARTLRTEQRDADDCNRLPRPGHVHNSIVDRCEKQRREHPLGPRTLIRYTSPPDPASHAVA